MEKTILIIAANPKDTAPLNLDAEIRKIQRESGASSEFDIRVFTATTYDDLKDALFNKKYNPYIVHFAGHGIGEKGILLVDHSGQTVTIATGTLADLFKIRQKYNPIVACVIFNVCYGQSQAKEIQNYVKYVIGMSKAIQDKYAIEFSKGFYQGLFSNGTFETAFELGQNSILHSMNQDPAINRGFVPDAAEDDEQENKIIADYEIPQIFINHELINVFENSRQNSIFPLPDAIISFDQWNQLARVLVSIDFSILKNVCRHTLKEDIQDIEAIMVSIQNFFDLKKTLLKDYPIRTNSDRLAILDFIVFLLKEKELREDQRTALKNWLTLVAKEKNIDLQDLNKETGAIIADNTVLDSYLLIVLEENTPGSNQYSLEAELIAVPGKKSMQISPNSRGITEISPEQIKDYISELIDNSTDTLNNFPNDYSLTVELFVPSEYLIETYERCLIPISRRRSKPLGSQYKFTIRCLEKYLKGTLFSQSKRKWQAIQKYLEKDCEEDREIKFDFLKSIYEKKTSEWNQIETRWIEKPFYSIAIVDRLDSTDSESVLDYFDIFQTSGIPIALWSRKEGVICDIDDNPCTVEDKFREILNIQALDELGQIFEKIRKLREIAYNSENREEYLGYHLGFICDDPFRIPTTLKQRLYNKGLQGFK